MSAEFNRRQGQVGTMWEGVPTDVFEHASSSQGLFEHEEIGLVGHAMARMITPVGTELLLLGSATAFREVEAIQRTQEILGASLHFSNITAVDIAPHFLNRAEYNLEQLRLKGITDRYSTLERSLERVSPDIIHNPGPIIMGVYNLDCLINNDKESDGTLVGLDQYGEEMIGILGPNTSILPLFYRNGRFEEGESIVGYKSPVNYKEKRSILQEYVRSHPNIVGMRVLIDDDKQNGTPPDSLFISTWFNPERLADIARSRGFIVNIQKCESSEKGVVLVLERQEDTRDAKSCTLVMNNVFGNLATPEQMTQFFSVIQNLGSQRSRRGEI